MTAALRAGILVCVTASTLGCGSDYRPPALVTTGVPASALGQVIDVDVELPGLRVQDAKFVGVRLELTLDLERTGPGTIPGRFAVERARVDMAYRAVEDLSDGRLELTVTDRRWFTGRLGPLRIGNTLFEIMLDGALADGGWRVAGRSWESQSGTVDRFEGWRRHRFLVAGTDFFSAVGRVAEVALVRDRELVVRNGLEFVSSDPVLRVTGGAVFAVNRLTFDNLQRLDPRRDFRTAWQATVGGGANPHDVLLLDAERGYVTRYEPPFNDVAVFDPADGEILASLPLGPLAQNPDGTPRADRMARVGSTVFVGLQDIDRSFSRYAEGKLAVIDTALDEVVGSIPLGGRNPGAIEVRVEGGRDKLYVMLSGIHPGTLTGELSGGVVVVDASQRVVERWALDDDDAGGNVGALAIASDRLGYVVVSADGFTHRLVPFDPLDAVVLDGALPLDEFTPEIEIDGGGVLAVPRRSPIAPALCLYRIPDDTSAGAPVPLGCAPLAVPPFSLEALDGSPPPGEGNPP